MVTGRLRYPRPAPHKPGRALRWTDKEDVELVQLMDELGEDWEKIAERLKDEPHVIGSRTALHQN